MPDPPREKERSYFVPPSGPVASRPASGLGYAELRCKTNFSFLEGASHPDELVNAAIALGYSALAITDRNSVAGVVRAHVAAKHTGLKLLIGAEVTPQDAGPIVLLATDREAYGGLCRLITTGRQRAKKGECQLTLDDITEYADGLLGIAVCPDPDRPLHHLSVYREIFGDRGYLAAERHLCVDDARRLELFQALSKQTGLPLVATNDVHYHERRRRYLHDALTATRHRCTVAELGERMFRNGERYLKPVEEMHGLFAALPGAGRRTVEVADRCHFSLDELKYDYPEELCPRGTTPLEHLTKLTWAGARLRYPEGIPGHVRSLVERELQLIEELHYEAYFLTVWDLVRFARSRDILCQGRGSAANSAVCYCLGVTAVDPDQIDLLFERFISKERGEAPDIDIDFEHERREEVIQYVYEKYGRERAGMTASVTTYRPKSAIRDIGKALGLSLDQVGRLSGVLEHYGESTETLERRFSESGLDPQAAAVRQMMVLLKDLLGFPRHLSQHVGGMVLSHRPLCELVPIENAAMPDRTVIQWDKDDLDALGILKVDCLSLGMLTAIRKGLALISETYDRPLELATVPKEDVGVYEMIQQADTMGVFQIESRAQMAMLPRLKPEKFYDLVIEVAIVRPGPIQGDMVHPYLRRRCGEEPVSYPSTEVEGVLRKTLGVPLFQEQAMKLAIVAGGFTPGEADQLRRAMGAWRKTGVMDQFRVKLVNGMLERGYDPQFAENLFNQIRGFGEYGFPESHAASFALLVYVSCWLKRYYPEAFLAALLNSQPMGFYAPAQLVANARQHEVEVRPVDIQRSQWDCTLEGGQKDAQGAVRLGFRMISGLSEAAVAQVLAERARGPFASLEEFRRRTGLSSALVTRLSRADVFRSFKLGRRESLWNALVPSERSPLERRDDATSQTTALQPMPAWEEVLADYRTTGLSLRDHPLRFLRDQLNQIHVTPTKDLPTWPEERPIAVAGLTLLRQRPGTAKGITFVTLEDETGMVNLIVHPEVWERDHLAARTSRLMLARGRLQRQKGIMHVVVERIEDLSGWIQQAIPKSRDFR